MRNLHRNEIAGTLKRHGPIHLNHHALFVTKDKTLFLTLQELSKLRVGENGEVKAVLEHGTQEVLACSEEFRQVYLLVGDGSHSTSYTEQMRQIK